MDLHAENGVLGPQITGPDADGIVARSLHPSDVDDQHTIASAWSVVRQLGRWPWPPDRAFTTQRSVPYAGPGFVWGLRQDDRLIGIEAGFPRVMLHTTEMDGDIATMPHVEGIAVPAGETIRLVPGGFHIMFMGLNGNPLIEGETFDATLEFENAGTVDVVFNVEARDSDIEGTDHSQH